MTVSLRHRAALNELRAEAISTLGVLQKADVEPDMTTYVTREHAGGRPRGGDIVPVSQTSELLQLWQLDGLWGGVADGVLVPQYLSDTADIVMQSVFTVSVGNRESFEIMTLTKVTERVVTVEKNRLDIIGTLKALADEHLTT